MAPINNQNSYSVHSTSSSSSSKTPFSCMCRGALSDGWEWFLPITRKGHFFQDSFFENSRSNFDAAIRDVLGKWGDSSLLTDNWHDDTINNLSRYRQLRSHNMKEENQAITVSSDSNSHKIVLDVHEFGEGEIKVKVIGEKEVLVEGVIEETKDRGSGTSSQGFSRRFPLPEDTDIDAISSVMSSDGILTITVPKKGSSTNQEMVKNIMNNHATSSSASQSSSTSANKSSQVESCSNASLKDQKTQQGTNVKEKYCECCYKKLQAEAKSSEGLQQHEELKIPIKINTSVANNQSSGVQETQNNLQSKAFSENLKTSSSSNYQNNCPSQKKEESRLSNQSQTNTQENRDANSFVSSDVKASSVDKDEGSRAIPISVNFSPLPITRRGLFFNDSIFENARNDFQSAVREVLSNWGERSSLLDDLSCYRSLRTRDLREENQAVKVNEDESNHKFVLDVHDFINGGEVNVKAVNDRELVVEGQVEKQEGGSKSVKRFYKRFVVPSDIILESVTSVMSSDGVLTITAPKKPPTIHIQDVTSPIRSDKAQETSSQSKQNSISEQQNATQSSRATSKNIRESCESQSSNVHQNFSCQQKTSAKEHIIPVCVEDRTKQSTVDNTIHITKVSSDNKQTEEKSLNRNVESSAVKENSGMSECSNTNSRRKVEITKNNTKGSEEKVHSSTVSQQNHNPSENLSVSSVGRLLPISRKGSFFHDSFFEGSRQSFQTAVKDVLQKFNENSQTDDLTSYRSLRQRCLSEKNQAVNVHEDEHCHKVTLDARDFTEGDISVSVVGERELVIEGRTENKKDSTSSSQSFCRRFLLPDTVDIDSITSAISTDGVLTVASAKSGSSGLSNAQKMSSEAHSRNESHNDSGHKWEENAVKESSEQSEGFSSRSVSKSYRSHLEQTSTNVL